MNAKKIRFGMYICLSLLIGATYVSDNWPQDQLNRSDFSSLAEFENTIFASEPNEAFSVIKDPEVLEKLENQGFSFGSMLNSILKNSFSSQSISNSNFDIYQSNTLFKSAVAIISQDLKEIINDENKASAGSAGVGMAFSKRIFDERWFQAKHGQFELIGIVNRTDRMSINTNTCGELRFIYRLSYNATKPQKMYSRLPITFMLKFNQVQDDGDYKNCQRFAQAWVNPSEPMNSDDYAKWLQTDKGPLGSENFQIQNFLTAELNMQAFRIPATIRRDMGGHASYLLRVFNKQQDAFVPGYLENTPDVTKISKNPTLKKELLAFLKNKSPVYTNQLGIKTRTDQFNRIDKGVVLIPEKFLAQKAISYSPYGVSRYSNKLFNQIFSESDFADLDYSQNDFVKTPDALIRRLNDSSCVGCHQGRAMAGFHFLGLDKSSTHPMNALNFEGSGHFQIELERRSQFLEKIRNGTWAKPARDFSIAPPEGKKAGYGHFCGLPNTNGFQHWQCEEGLTCQKSDEAKDEKILGKCLPTIQKAGDPCMYGYVTQEDRNKDKIILDPTKKCNNGNSNYSCSPVVGPAGTKLGGFPSGSCGAATCKNLDSKTEVCGHTAAAGFSNCVGDSSKTFEYCLNTYSKEVGLGLCNKDRACRNDYVCVRVSKDKGACMPSYFVFQVRQDGHPAPQ